MRIVTALLLAVVGALAFQASGTFARANTLYVGPVAGTNAGCNSPGYTSVQKAVDAANPGETVYLCGANTYLGPVVISKSLTLTGDHGATIAAPSPFPATPLSRLPSQFADDNLFVPQAIVFVWGSGVRVDVEGLTVTGPLPGNGGCAENEFGVLAIAGADLSMTADQVLNIHDVNSALYGCQFGVGIQVGREYWPTADFTNYQVEDFTATADISNTVVSGYMKNGVTVDGPGSSARLVDNTVNGSNRDTLFSPIVAQNGIQISRGAGGQVQGNTVTGNTYTGPGYASSSGVIIFGGCGDPLVTGVDVANNRLINNDVGIYLVNYNADCTAQAATPTDDRAIHNTISNDKVTNVGSGYAYGFPYIGYQAGIDDVGNHDLIVNNDISGPGYEPRTTPGGPYTMPIDTTSFPTTDPRVHANR